MQIKTIDAVSEKVEINSGVLQGETWSPISLIIFFSDIFYFEANGTWGVPMDNRNEEIKLLLRQIVIFMLRNSNHINLKKILDDDCSQNSLDFNPENSLK